MLVSARGVGMPLVIGVSSGVVSISVGPSSTDTTKCSKYEKPSLVSHRWEAITDHSTGCTDRRQTSNGHPFSDPQKLVSVINSIFCLPKKVDMTGKML